MRMKHVVPFTLIFRQPHATASLLLGTLLVFIPIVGHIVLNGWVVRVHRAVMSDEEMPALSLEHFSRDLKLGMGPFVVQMVMVFFIILVILPLLVLPGVIGVLAIPALADSGLSEGAAVTVFVAGVLVFVLLALVVLYLLVMATHAALITAELADDVSDAMTGLRPRSILPFFKLVKRELFMTSVGLAFGSSILMLAGMLLLTLGIYPATVVMFAAGGHYRAQIYAAYLERGGAEIPFWHPPVAQE